MKKENLEFTEDQWATLSKVLRSTEAGAKIAEAIEAQIAPKKKVLNLTGHEINFLNQFGEVVSSIPSHGFVRSFSPRHLLEEIDGVPIYASDECECNLPPMEENTYLIVSLRTAIDAGCREDLLCVTETKRDATGRIVGCRGVIRP